MEKVILIVVIGALAKIFTNVLQGGQLLLPNLSVVIRCWLVGPLDFLLILDLLLFCC